MANTTKKKKKKQFGFSTPTHYFPKTGNRCRKMEVSFTVDTNYIVGTIYKMLNYDGTENIDPKYPEDKITKKNIEERLRNILYHQGTDYFENLEYSKGDGEANSHRWNQAEEWARKLFPKWFENYHGNALRFITEDT